MTPLFWIAWPSLVYTEEIIVSVPATHAELTLVGRCCMKNSVCALVLTGYDAGFGFGAVKWWIALLSNMMTGLTDQWHRDGCNAVLLKGGGGGNGGNVEEVCVCSICECRPPSAASAVMDLPLELTSSAQSDSHGAHWWESLAMSVIFSFRSFHPVRLQWLAMQALLSRSRDMCGWLTKKSMSDEYSCEHFKPGFCPIYWLTILECFWSREIVTGNTEGFLLNSVKAANKSASPCLKNCQRILLDLVSWRIISNALNYWFHTLKCIKSLENDLYQILTLLKKSLVGDPFTIHPITYKPVKTIKKNSIKSC